jgi:hypothetical protein
VIAAGVSRVDCRDNSLRRSCQLLNHADLSIDADPSGWHSPAMMVESDEDRA